MFDNKKILTPWFRLMARQLRRPGGLLARLTGNKMNKSNRPLYNLTFENLEANDNDKILEIGFGNGKFFPELNSKAKNIHITGIDLSHEMVRQAVRNNIDLHKSGRMNAKVGSSDDLPFPDDSFDKVFCINVIYFWENPTSHLKEILRVLKPGGLFITGFRPKENMLQLPFTRYGFLLYTEDEWKELLTAKGFQFIKSEKINDPEIKINGQRIN
jgi:ubiquinone/menaquinone biosynthesis C-methylase UbiE